MSSFVRRSVEMAHAVVIQVKIDPDSDQKHRHSILNDFVVPEAKALPGFAQGIWMNDGGGTGTCVVLFDTKDHASAAIVTLTRPGGPPIISSGVHEVEIGA
jgi:hypothetical protein